jgi:hypothetical protein
MSSVKASAKLIKEELGYGEDCHSDDSVNERRDSLKSLFSFGTVDSMTLIGCRKLTCRDVESDDDEGEGEGEDQGFVSFWKQMMLSNYHKRTSNKDSTAVHRRGHDMTINIPTKTYDGNNKDKEKNATLSSNALVFQMKGSKQKRVATHAA